MSPTTAGVLLVLVAATVALTVLHRGARRADAAERAQLFDEVVPLLADARLSGDPSRGYPVLTGRWEGRPVTVRALVDTLALRKLPVLWVEVLVERPLEVAGTVNVLLRPQGCEVFSPDAGFPHELPPPPGVPRPSRVSCAGADRAPTPAALARALDPAADLLADPVTKELGIGRRGVRVVLRVAEGDQASYRTTRRAVFDRPRADAAAVRRALDVLTAVGDAVGDRVPAGTSTRTVA